MCVESVGEPGSSVVEAERTGYQGARSLYHIIKRESHRCER